MRRFIAMVFALVLAGVVWQAAPGPAQAAPGATRYVTLLSAQEVIPGPGDADGDGDLSISIGRKTGTFCWFMNTTNVAAPLTAVHLHRGDVSESGEQVALLEGPTTSTGPAECNDLDRRLVKDIVKQPSAYYIDVHNEEFPDGALRGQLTNGAPVSLFMDFSGGEVVPGPGDANGAGGGPVGLSGTELCFSLTINNVTEPLTAVHLHRGAVGESGEQVALLHSTSADYQIGDCVDIGADLVSEIREHPQGFYIDVHNEEFPGGAVRSQLQ